MKFKYYAVSLFFALFCVALSFVFLIPYGFSFDEKEKRLDKAIVSVVAPMRGERKLKLDFNERGYWLSCYGVSNICNGENINQKIMIKNVKILLNQEGETNFLNGILMEYHDENGYHTNDKFNPKEDTLLNVLAANAIFSLKLSFAFLLISVVLLIKKI